MWWRAAAWVVHVDRSFVPPLSCRWIYIYRTFIGGTHCSRRTAARRPYRATALLHLHHFILFCSIYFTDLLIHLFIYLLIYLYIYLFICLFVYCLLIYLFTCLLIYLFIVIFCTVRVGRSSTCFSGRMQYPYPSISSGRRSGSGNYMLHNDITLCEFSQLNLRAGACGIHQPPSVVPRRGWRQSFWSKISIQASLVLSCTLSPRITDLMPRDPSLILAGTSGSAHLGSESSSGFLSSHRK